MREAERLRKGSGMGEPDECNILLTLYFFVPPQRSLCDKTATGLAQAFSGGSASRVLPIGANQSWPSTLLLLTKI